MNNYELYGEHSFMNGIADLNGDGTLEIVVSTYASCNGNTEGGKDDCHCYVEVVDAYGNEVFQREIGEAFTGMSVGIDDVNNDGYMEIVGAAAYAFASWGRLFVLDHEGNFLSDRDSSLDREFRYALVWGGITDFDDDGYKEIIVGDSQGGVAIYDSSLNKLKDVIIASSGVTHPQVIGDINGDGAKEIIVGTRNSDVIVLDQNLKTIWRRNFNNSKIYQPVVKSMNRGGCADSLLILADRLYLYSFVNVIQKCELNTDILQLKLQEKLEYYEDIAERAFLRDDFSLAKEYYSKVSSIYGVLGNVEEKNRILDQLRTLDFYLETEILLEEGRSSLLEGNCGLAWEDLQIASVRYESMGDIQKTEEIQILLGKCQECEEAFRKYADANSLVGEADGLVRDAKEKKQERKYTRAIDLIEIALEKYERAIEEVNKSIEIFEKIELDKSVEKMRICLGDIERTKKEADAEKGSIYWGFRVWFSAIIVASIICWLWSYYILKSRHLFVGKIGKIGFMGFISFINGKLRNMKGKRLHSILGAILIGCLYIIFGTGSLVIIFLVGLFAASSFIYTFLFSGAKEIEEKSDELSKEKKMPDKKNYQKRIKRNGRKRL